LAGTDVALQIRDAGAGVGKDLLGDRGHVAGWLSAFRHSWSGSYGIIASGAGAGIRARGVGTYGMAAHPDRIISVRSRSGSKSAIKLTLKCGERCLSMVDILLVAGLLGGDGLGHGGLDLLLSKSLDMKVKRGASAE
jgi:hypothetical protein